MAKIAICGWLDLEVEQEKPSVVEERPKKSRHLYESKQESLRMAIDALGEASAKVKKV